MINSKIYKPIETQAQCDKYAALAKWCNKNNAHINDMGDFYLVEENEIHIPTAEEIKDNLINAVQAHMDNTAREKGYDNILSACSYVNTGVEQFDNEGAKAREWRSACWAYCYEQLALFEAGKRDVPSSEELINELPKIEWGEQ